MTDSYDRQIARLLGWQDVALEPPHQDVTIWIDPQGAARTEGELPRYTTDRAAALLILDWCSAHAIDWQIGQGTTIHNRYGLPYCRIGDGSGSAARTLAAAISEEARRKLPAWHAMKGADHA